MFQARCPLHAPTAWSDRTTFLRSWLRDPPRIGAALPSRRALAVERRWTRRGRERA